MSPLEMSNLKILGSTKIVTNNHLHGSKLYFWELEYGYSDSELLRFDMEYSRFKAGYKIMDYLKKQKVVR